MKFSIILAVVALLGAALLTVACAANSGDSTSDSFSNTEVLDDDDGDACAGYANSTECAFDAACEWVYPDDATDPAAARVFPSAATDETGDGGYCQTKATADDDDDDDAADCASVCDDIIGCGYADDATGCVEVCADGSLDILGAAVASDETMLAAFAACVETVADSCAEYGDLWACAEDACCVNQATATDVCGLDFQADCPQ